MNEYINYYRLHFWNFAVGAGVYFAGDEEENGGVIREYEKLKNDNAALIALTISQKNDNINLVNKLHDATNADKWNVGLPEKVERGYLVTAEDIRTKKRTVRTLEYSFVFRGKKGRVWDWRRNENITRIVSWRPLPEPMSKAQEDEMNVNVCENSGQIERKEKKH